MEGGGLRHTRKMFPHMQTLQLPVKGFKFLLILGTHDHLAENVLPFATSSLTRDIHNSHLRGPVTITPVPERLGAELVKEGMS